MSDKFDDLNGNLDFYLICPVCGRAGIVLYSKRKPVYCSDACRQKAYRERNKKRNKETVTKLKSRLVQRFGPVGTQLLEIYNYHGYNVGHDAEAAAWAAMAYARQKLRE